ncbi:Uncharacterised protein [Segatella copri]|nr:Uncharacterised protein [Segatella copri]
MNVTSLRTARITLGPVIIHIDFCIQSQFRQQKVDYRLGDATIIIAFLIAVLVGK